MTMYLATTISTRIICIFVDPVSFVIISIINWEYTGFYPPEFEFPLWTTHPYEIRQITRRVKEMDLISLGQPILDAKGSRL